MADVRFVPKSATKMVGALALVGALAGAGALLVWGCTDNSGSGKFVEPNRPFDAARRGWRQRARATPRSMQRRPPTRLPTTARAADGANSDLGADR